MLLLLLKTLASSLVETMLSLLTADIGKILTSHDLKTSLLQALCINLLDNTHNACMSELSDLSHD